MAQLLLVNGSQPLAPAAGKQLTLFVARARSRGFQVSQLLLHQKFKEELGQLDFPGLDAIVIGGGDGTLNWAVNLLLEAGPPLPPLGVLPLGTANDFAQQLGAPRFTVEGLLAALKSGHTRPVDVGMINGKYFINVVAAGEMARVASQTSRAAKKLLRIPAYYLEGMRRFQRSRPFPLCVQRDGTDWTSLDSHLFLILNSKGAGTFRRLAPHASLDDGQLHLLLFTNLQGFRAWMPLLLNLRRGQLHRDSRVSHVPGTNFLLHGPPGVATVVDGEPGPPFPLHVGILPQKLHFFCPR